MQVCTTEASKLQSVASFPLLAGEGQVLKRRINYPEQTLILLLCGVCTSSQSVAVLVSDVSLAAGQSSGL